MKAVKLTEIGNNKSEKPVWINPLLVAKWSIYGEVRLDMTMLTISGSQPCIIKGSVVEVSKALGFTGVKI